MNKHFFKNQILITAFLKLFSKKYFAIALNCIKLFFSPKIKDLRKHSARFDIFINGLFIADRDYIVEAIDNDLYIKFIKNNFPPFDRFGNPYDIEDSDEVKINGDLEIIN